MISACLQDALVPIADMAYLKREKRFVMIANRFCWECLGEAAPRPSSAPLHDASFEDAESNLPYERVNSLVSFERVQSVKTQGFNPRDKGQILNLLSVSAADRAIILHFSSNYALRLETGAIDCRLADVGEPWPTRQRPQHPLDEDGEAG